MKVSKRDETKIRKLINTFIKDQELAPYKLRFLIFIDDVSPNNATAASIIILDQEKEFNIRVYTDYVGSYHDLSYYIMHELTHLYLHEINTYREFLERNNADTIFKNELEDMYEKITYKLSKVFFDNYMQKL